MIFKWNKTVGFFLEVTTWSQKYYFHSRKSNYLQTKCNCFLALKSSIITALHSQLLPRSLIKAPKFRIPLFIDFKDLNIFLPYPRPLSSKTPQFPIISWSYGRNSESLNQVLPETLSSSVTTNKVLHFSE